MNKKTNTLLFVLGATVFNVLVTFICLVVLLLIYGRFVAAGFLDESTAVWGIPVVILGSMAGAFFIYKVLINQIIKRLGTEKLEKYFDPIFRQRRHTLKRGD